MADYAVTDSRSDEYRARAQEFFNSWGLDRSRPEKWTGSRDHFSEDDKDLFLRGDHLPSSMQNDEGFYMGRQTRDLSKMNEDQYYTGAQKAKVNQAMAELGMDKNDSETKSGRVLSYMFQKHMDGLTEPAVDSKPVEKAKERVQTWEQDVESGESSYEIFGQQPTNYDHEIFGQQPTNYDFTNNQSTNYDFTNNQSTNYDFTNNQFTNYDKPNPYTQSNKATELLDTYKTGFSNVSSAADSNNANALAVALPNTAGSAQPIADFSSVKNEEEDPYSWQTQVGMR